MGTSSSSFGKKGVYLPWASPIAPYTPKYLFLSPSDIVPSLSPAASDHTDNHIELPMAKPCEISNKQKTEKQSK